MKNVFLSFICLSLCGCFKSAPKPNPQISDTIVSTPHLMYDFRDNGDEMERREELTPYDEKDVICKIYFAFDSFALSERDKSTLTTKVLPLLKEDIHVNVLLAGYSDWRGKANYNDRLGERRASAVADYLSECGIEESRLEVKSYGSSCATPDLSKADSLKDRRCDIVLLKH